MSLQNPPSGEHRTPTRPVGAFRPANVGPASFRRLESRLIDQLREIPSASSTVSDVLDQLGWNLSVAGSRLPVRSGGGTVVGHAVTLSYLPERLRRHDPLEGRLAHRTAFAAASPGDVVVVDARAVPGASVLGGLAAEAAASAQLAGCVVDGSVRDLEEIRGWNVPLWAADSTPRSGNLRAEAVAINGPIGCGEVQVLPGDLVVADETGVCFVPLELADFVVAQALGLAAAERSGAPPTQA